MSSNNNGSGNNFGGADGNWVIPPIPQLSGPFLAGLPPENRKVAALMAASVSRSAQMVAYATRQNVANIQREEDVSLSSLQQQEAVSLSSLQQQEAISLSSLQQQQAISLSSLQQQQAVSLSSLQQQQAISLSSLQQQQAVSLSSLQQQRAVSLSSLQQQQDRIEWGAQNGLVAEENYRQIITEFSPAAKTMNWVIPTIPQLSGSLLAILAPEDREAAVMLAASVSRSAEITAKTTRQIVANIQQQQAVSLSSLQQQQDRIDSGAQNGLVAEENYRQIITASAKTMNWVIPPIPRLSGSFLASLAPEDREAAVVLAASVSRSTEITANTTRQIVANIQQQEAVSLPS